VLDVVMKRSRSLSHLLMSSCSILTPAIISTTEATVAKFCAGRIYQVLRFRWRATPYRAWSGCV